MELTERVDVSLIAQLNTLTFHDFKKYYDDYSNHSSKKTDVKSIFKKISTYCQSSIKNNGITKRTYEYSLETIKEKGGRLFCGKSIQGMPKFIRGFLMKHTTDIDAKNCHPVILRYICRKHNICCNNLNFYIENRDKILEKSELTKVDFLVATNNDKKNKKIKDSFFIKYDNELKNIQNSLCSINEYKEIVDSVPEYKKLYNWNGCAINRILCYYEKKILQTAIETIKSLNIEIAALMFDGLMIYGNYYEDNNLLKKIEKTVEQKFKGLNMKWEYKKHCDFFKLNNNIPSEIVLPDYLEKLIENPRDCVIANVVKDFYGKYYKCIDFSKKIWLEFKDRFWQESMVGMRPLIDTKFYDFLKKELDELNDKLNNLQEGSIVYNKIKQKNDILKNITEKCQKTNDKNNIYKELLEKCLDTSFVEKLNKKPYLLPIKKGKIINLKDLSIRERTYEDLFTYECNSDYIELKSDDEKYVEKYFMELFCQNKKIVKIFIDVIKSAISGEKLRFIFFCTGTGRNGKSLLFNLLNEIFNKSMDIVSDLVIINNRFNKSNINTEIEKLDKIRIGYVTELKEEDSLNVESIKRISGNDKMDFRGLNRSNITILPTANLFVLTNELPRCKIDQAIQDRIVIFPFDNVFEINRNFEKEIMEKKDIIFSYILQKGEIKNNFDFPEEMINIKNEYVEDNSQDTLKKFIEDKISIEENKKIKRDDFRREFNNWCKEMSYPIDTRSDRLFSREMKKFNIECVPINGKRYYKNVIFVDQ